MWSTARAATTNKVCSAAARCATAVSVFPPPMVMASVGVRRYLATHHSGRFDVGRFYPVYVHPLSQIVLEHLQVSRSDWLMRNGLDRGLTINKDGTFVINFPPESDAGRIWTSYDADKKQHWLTVYKDTLLGRYPLKGSNESSWHKEKLMVQETVDRMIERLSEADRKNMAAW